MIGSVLLALMLAPIADVAATEERRVNDGQLVLQGIPDIPATLVEDLLRYQNVRSASVLDWTADGRSLYVRTRFAEVEQIHRVDLPGGARQQLTFFDEPVGQVTRQRGGDLIAFSMDTGGSEFDQIFLFDPATAAVTRMTEGEFVNRSMRWDRSGRRLAFRSTRRNGRSNDLWLIDDLNAPSNARMVLESPDGSYWSPVDFSADGRWLLVGQYLSINDARIHLLELDSGERRLLAGSESSPSANFAGALDDDADGLWFTSDRQGEFTLLYHQSLAPGAVAVPITRDIPWDVDDVVLSDDGRRGAFVTNEDGIDRLYLLDPREKTYQKVDGLPRGLIGGLVFSPDGRRLAMSLNTPKTPTDAFVLELGETALESGALVRWTFSEVGGLDSETFVEPELIRYPSFDRVDGEPRRIPAFVYRPAGPGPHPVIISIHGGPEGQSRPRFSSTIQYWVQKLGVAVILPNVRGSAGYGKSYLKLDNGFKREDSVRDIGALLDWIGDHDDFDADRVAVSGGSYGGYMVLASAVHYSDRLRAAVDRVGISNFVTFLENTQDYRRDARRQEYGDERDPAMRAHLEAISPLNRVDRIRIPLLVAQGQNDPRVPVSESEQIVRALRDSGIDVWYMNGLNEGHGFARKENRDVDAQVAVMFLRRHLLAQD